MPSSDRMGVALTSVRMLRPSGTDSSISSAWVPVVSSSWWTRGSSSKETSRPSARRQVTTSRSCSVGQPSVRISSAMRRRLTVERDRPAGGRVQHHDADRRGLDQCLEVGPRPLHVAVRPGVRDRRRRLRSEEHQDLLVLGGERLPVLLVAEEEVAEMLAPVVHRSSLQRPGGPGDRGKAERFQVAGEVRHPKRFRMVPEVLEEPGPVRPVHQLPALLRRQAGGDEVLESSRLVDGRDHALTGAGEGPRAVDHLLEHGAQIEAPADAEDRRAQPGRAVGRGSAPVRIADRSAPAAG